MLSITFFYSLLISSFIGSLLIVLDIDGNYMLGRISNENYRVIGFFWICYIMIMMPLTMLFISQLLGFNAKKEYNEFLRKPIVLFRNTDDFFFVFSVLTVISILSVIYTVMSVDKIPLIEMFKGSNNLGELRIQASHAFSGNVYIKNIFAIGLTPILSLVAYIFASFSSKRRWRFLFVLLFPCAIFINIYDLQKSPIFFYFLMFILINVYIGKLRLNYKYLVLFGFSGVFLIILLYAFVQKVTSLDQFLSYNSGPIGRLILSQIAPFYLHLDLFGNQMDFLAGKSLPGMLLGLYDLEQIRSAKIVMEHYFPERVDQGIAGVLNTLYAGEAYANFGNYGILFGTIYIALVIQLIYIAFIRMPKHPVVVTVFVYFTVNIPRTLVGGFADFLFNPFWILVSVIFLGSLILIKIKYDFVADFKNYIKRLGN